MKTLAKMLSLSLAAALPLSAHAHRMFFVPSSTVLSENDHRITVDAAVSNDLFFFERGLNLDALLILAPDGSAVAPENVFTGKMRNSFDVPLDEEGTYKIASAGTSMMASWEEDGQPKRWRGSEATFKTEVPKDARNLRVMHSVNRVETFVTVGKPSTGVFKPTGTGLELVPVTHPNDLYAGETATFQLLLDGKPASDIQVTVIPGGTRYRDRVDEIATTTRADGRFSVKWPAAGLYWLGASLGGGMEGGPGGPRAGKPEDGKMPPPAAGAGKKMSRDAAPVRRVNYSATLEVLP